MTARAPLTDAEITLALKVAREEWSENDLMVQAIRDLQQARADLAALRAAVLDATPRGKANRLA